MSAALIRPVGVYGVALTPADHASFEACYCSQEIVESAGIRRVDRDEGREVVGRHDSNDYSGLFFPYIWPGTTQPYSHRLRLDNPPFQIKGGMKVTKGKYLSAPGYSNGLYFHPATSPSALLDVNVPLVFLEGEKKTLAAFRFSYDSAGETADVPSFIPAGLPGVNGWRSRAQKTEDSNGRRISISAPIAHLDRIEWRGRKTYILFDANTSTNALVAHARLELSIEMVSRGAEVWIIDLPVEDGINGFDDYLARHGVEPAKKLFDNARAFDPKERLAKFHYTDHGNELAFETLYGNDFLYDWTAKAWRSWNGIIWALDAMGSVDRAMIEVAAERLYATAGIQQEDGSEAEGAKKRAIAGALKLQNVKGRQSALLSATSNPRFARIASDFDRDDFLFACGNGVINLKSLEFRAGRREDMLTQQTSVFWRPEADYSLWLKFLSEVFAGRPEIVRFIQRSVGYSLTGLIREEIFFILYGLGRNGKGVFIRVLSELFGIYGATAEFSALIADKNRSRGPRNDIAALAGKRLVTAQESKEGAQFDESLIKSLTGGDLITARFLNKEFFTFRPTWKIWLAVNHKPEIHGTDTGIWSRPKLIPFTESFIGREDRGLKDRLLDPIILSGVLRWAVEGCRDYLEHGLEYPEEVLQATAAYKSESDLVGRFIDECCERGDYFQAKARPLYHAFSRWAEGTAGLTETAFGRRMGEVGIPKEKKTAGTVYVGLRLALDETGEFKDQHGGLVAG